MRRILLLSAALLLLVGACWDPHSFATAAAAGGTGGAASACDGANGCADCTQCAMNGPCASLVTSCLADSACSGINQCATPPCDAACQQNCVASNPSGAAAWDAMTSCIDCTQCPKNCPGLRACP